MALTQIPLSTLAGTSGTPVSETNKLIDDDDARMEKADTAVQPTGTPVANQLAYWTTAQILAGADLLSCDATNSRIGIGTLAPHAALHVVGAGLTAHDLPGFAASDESRAKTLGVQGDTFAYLVGYTPDKSFACGISTNGKAFAGSITAHDFELRRENVAKVTLTDAGATLPAETASRAVYLDASKTLKASAVTTTELESLTGIEANVQDQLGAEASARIAGDAAVESLVMFRPSFERRGIAADGSAPALIIPASTITAFGLSDWTIKLPIIVLPTWQPVSAITLFDSVAANLGVRITLLTSGLIRVQFGNGTNLTTFQYDSTDPLVLADYAAAEITVTAERLGNLCIYVNGQALGGPIDISTSSAQTLTSASDWRLLSDGTTHHVGWLYEQFAKDLQAHDASAIADRWNHPDLWKTEQAGASYYASDFTTSVDGWGGSYSTAVYNQTVNGTSGWYGFYADASTSTHQRYQVAWGTAQAGKQIRFRMKLWMPVNSNATGVEIRIDPSATKYLDTASLGTEQVVELDETVTIASDSTILRVLLQNSEGLQSFTGAGSSDDDLLYFKDVRIESIGTQLLIDCSTPGRQKLDLQPHSLHAYTTMPDTTDTQLFVLRGKIDWVTSSIAQNLVAPSLEVLGEDDIIDAIYAKSTSGEHFAIGDEADSDRYFTEATIGANWTKLAIAEAFPDGTNYEIKVTPMDGSGSPEARTDSLHYHVVVRRLA